MNVLVIGGTGFLSSAVVRICQEAGHTVAVVTRGSANRPAPPGGVETLTANRSDADSLREAVANRSFDIVIDCILFRPEDADAAIRIFDGRVGRYVFISTDFVYGGEPRIFPLPSDAPREALNPYGANKAACEDRFAAAHAATGFPAVTLRPPHILGAGGLLGTGSLEGRDAWLLWRLRHQVPFVLLDGGALLIQPVHKDDIARAALAIAQSEPTPGRAYNIAGPDCVTTLRYYEIIAEIARTPPPVVCHLPSEAYVAAFPEKAAFAQNRCYSLQGLKEDANFTPGICLSDALAEVVADLDRKGDPEGMPPPLSTPLTEALRAAHTAAVKDLLAHGA